MCALSRSLSEIWRPRWEAYCALGSAFSARIWAINRGGGAPSRDDLLQDVGSGTYGPTDNSIQDLELHSEGQHNPQARELAVEHGFVRQVTRAWTDERGNHIVHTITQFTTPENAESFLSTFRRTAADSPTRCGLRRSPDPTRPA